MSAFKALPFCMLAAACSPLSDIGRAPDLSAPVSSVEYAAMMTPSLPQTLDTAPVRQSSDASLWTGDRGSLLGDQRAMQRGDILTVVIEIDDSAQFSNSSDRSRSASQDMGVNDLFGIPQRIDNTLPDGASMGSAVDLTSSSTAQGDGSINRQEKLALRVAATVTNVLPNGILEIHGTQEVRVNFELRELLVTGYVRPADVTRQNEVAYDKIASARISYGGEGQLTEVQQPRYGQQLAEKLLPF